MKKLNLKTKNQVEAGFSMSSLTDIIFLLLIFFILTTSFDSIEGINVSLPKSSFSEDISNNIKIILTADSSCFIDNHKVTLSELEDELRNKVINNKAISDILIEADKNISLENLIEVANIAASLEKKISIATIEN